MKKLCLSIIAVAGIVSAPFVFADNAVAKGYYSTLHPQTSLSASMPMFPPTDITITNASSNTIYAVVPNSPVNDQIYAGNNDHIRHNTYYGDTFISLQDPNRSQFWSGSLCRLALVTVYGNPGNYRVNVDRELCN